MDRDSGFGRWFVVWLAATACLPMPATAAEAPGRESRLVWFGTTTQGKSDKGLESEGIYVSRLDAKTGNLSPPRLAAKAINPSFLARHPTRPLLYAVSEVAEPPADGVPPTGAVTAFAIDPDSGMLEKLGDRPSGGGGPCHVSVDPSGRCVVVANYVGGSTACLRIAEDGSLEPIVDGLPGGLVRHEGKSVNPVRQEAPHAHCATPSPDGRFVLVADLGIDKILVHSLDAAAGTIRPHGHASVAAGAGPRHLAFDPDGRRVYAIDEFALDVTAFEWDPRAGGLRHIATVSLLPPEVVDTKGMLAAEVAVHPNGRFLYGSTRGHDTIAMFSLDGGSGKPDWLGVEPVRVRGPRSFAIDPTGRWLLAAGQGSDNVTVFSLEPGSGRLRFNGEATGQTAEVPRPVCILFDD